MGQLGNWDFHDSSLNTKLDQINRQKSAMQCQVIKLNRDTQEALFANPRTIHPVRTTLTHCECHDFNFNETSPRREFMPCMHIYRLAIELGLMKAKYFNKPKTHSELKAEESIKIHNMKRDPAQWGRWKKEIHSGIGQRDSQRRAYEIFDRQDFSIKTENSAIVSGYRTTLENCTCADFEETKVPCKHIYCLALAKGIKLKVSHEEYQKERELFEESFIPVTEINGKIKDDKLKSTSEDHPKKRL